MMFRRRREFKTNYKKRKKALISRLPLLYVFKSNKNIWGQVIKPSKGGDLTLAHASSKDLEKHGWKYSRKNYPAAYLVGLLLGKRAIKAGIQEAIFYSGVKGFIAKSKAAAFIKGVVDAGVNVHVDESVFPEEKIIRGEQIVDYAKRLKEAGYNGPQFSKLLEEIEKMPEVFEDLKEKILKGEIE